MDKFFLTIIECFEIFLKNILFFFLYNNFFYNNFYYLNSITNIFFFLKMKSLIKPYNVVFINHNNDKYIINKHLKFNIFFFKFCNLIKFNFLKNSKNSEYEIYFRFYKFCNIFLYNFFLQNNNLLLLDGSYKNNYSFLTNLYSLKDIINYNSFFFPNPSFFTRRGWIFTFDLFCKNFSVSLFILANYKLYEKHFNELSSLNIPTITLNYADSYKNIYKSDYSFFYNVSNSLYNRYMLVYSLNNIYFVSLNIKNFIFKKKYLYFFFKFFNNIYYT